VGDNGTIIHTVDSGETWEKQISPTNINLIGLKFISPKLGWIIAQDATILYTSDGGKTWHIQESPPKPTMTVYDSDLKPLKVDHIMKRAQFPSSSEGWAVGEYGAILHNVDGGVAWTEQDSKIAESLRDICFVDDHQAWAVGLDGTILHTNDAGVNWNAGSFRIMTYSPTGTSPRLGNTGHDLESVYFVNPKEGWIVGKNGIILHTFSGGPGWSVQKSKISDDFYSVYFGNSQDGWIVGQNGRILHTKDSGTNWEWEGSGVNKDLYKIARIVDNIIIAIGEDGTILKWKGGG